MSSPKLSLLFLIYLAKKCSGLCCSAACSARNFFKTQNPRLINKRGFKSRADYNGTHTVYVTSPCMYCSLFATQWSFFITKIFNLQIYSWGYLWRRKKRMLKDVVWWRVSASFLRTSIVHDKVLSDVPINVNGFVTKLDGTNWIVRVFQLCPYEEI